MMTRMATQHYLGGRNDNTYYNIVRNVFYHLFLLNLFLLFVYFYTKKSTLK